MDQDQQPTETENATETVTAEESAPANVEAVPGNNSGTPATMMDGGTQPPQPSVAGTQFDQQVTEHVNAIEKSTPDAETGALPGGVTAEADSTLVLEVTSAQEFADYTFDDGLANIKVDDSGSGAASIALDVHSQKDGVTVGKLRARIIGDSHSRVYVFRKDDTANATTTFVAKYTPHP